MHGHLNTQLCLLKFKAYFNFTLSSDDVNFTKKVSNYQIDGSLKVFACGDCLDTLLDYIFQSERYSCLSKVVKAALFIFTSPQIEVSFNLINDIIDKRSS